MLDKRCDVCPGGDMTRGFFNAKTLNGSWAYLCPTCFKSVGRYGFKCHMTNGVFSQDKLTTYNKIPEKTKNEEILDAFFC